MDTGIIKISCCLLLSDWSTHISISILSSGYLPIFPVLQFPVPKGYPLKELKRKKRKKEKDI